MKTLLKIACIYWGSILLIFISFACKSASEKQIHMQEITPIENFSGGTGICQNTNGLWVIGYDSPYLHLINEKGFIQEKYLLSQIPAFNQEKYSRIVKPDFQAIDIFNDTLVVVGSGSQFFSRDTAFVFDCRTRKILLKRSLHNLYQKFYLLGDFPIGKSINIEGLANDGKYFYFFHSRIVCGNNRIYRINKTDMVNYLFDVQKCIPEFSSYIFDLPYINDTRSGFSGACYSQKENALFVCISVEETDEMNEDGNILGSFFGKIRLYNHVPKKIDYWPIVNSENHFLIAKFKSLCPSGNENTGHFFALYENGASKTGFYQLNLQ